VDREVIAKAKAVLSQHRDQLIAQIAWHGIERLESVAHLAHVQLALSACLCSLEDVARSDRKAARATKSKARRSARSSASVVRLAGGELG
jgi:hypothetical protein